MLAVGADQVVDYGRGQAWIAGSEPDLDHERARHGFDSQAALESFQEIGLGGGRLRVLSCSIQMKTVEKRGEAAVESGGLVKLQIADHTPRQLVAAEVIGQGFLLQRRGEDRGRSERTGWIEVEHGCGRSTQRDLGRGLELVGCNEAIKQASQQEAALNGSDEPTAAPQHLKELAQGC